MSDTNRQAFVLSGAVRIDEKIPRLSARLEPGEIAVIEFPDLDRSSALSLLSQRPLAVLNAAPSTTGRKASLGAKVLVDAGIILIDDLGPDLMTLNEGAVVEIRGSEVYLSDELVAVGNNRRPGELRDLGEGGRDRLEIGVQSFAQGAAIAWQNESAMLLDSFGVPRISALASRRTATPTMVVAPGQQTAGQLRGLRRFVRDFSPSIIAVAEAADLISLLGRKPDVIIGDLSGVSEKTLRSGAQLVVLERPDGTIPGVERLTNYGITYKTMSTSASGIDAAILLADANGAEQIVTVSRGSGIVEFLDRSSSEATAGVFIDVRCQKKLVSAEVVKEMYRPGISSWQLAILMVAALLAIGAAVWFTPLGGDVSFWITDVFSGSGLQAPGTWLNPGSMMV